MAANPKHDERARRTIKLVKDQTLPETQMHLLTDWRAVPAGFRKPILTVDMWGNSKTDSVELSLETTWDAVEGGGVLATTVLSPRRLAPGTHWSVIDAPVGPWIRARASLVLGRPRILNALVTEGSA